MKLIGKIFLIIVVSFSLFTGCGKHDEKGHDIIEIEAGNDIVVNVNEITEKATYYNYNINDIIIQVFAIKASDGTVRTLFNTCNACGPSQNAYFIQVGDEFECQNCKSRFHTNDIGLSKSYGCSPIAILDEDKIVESDNITISSGFIETYKSKFESINNYKEEI